MEKIEKWVSAVPSGMKRDPCSTTPLQLASLLFNSRHAKWQQQSQKKLRIFFVVGHESQGNTVKLLKAIFYSIFSY